MHSKRIGDWRYKFQKINWKFHRLFVIFLVASSAKWYVTILQKGRFHGKILNCILYEEYYVVANTPRSTVTQSRLTFLKSFSFR